MRLGFKDLTLWSFVMAGAHGAGLMLVPVLLKLSGTMHEMGHQAREAHEHWGHGVHLFLTNPGALADIAAVAVHTLSMFAAMALVALVVYDRLGLMILKRTWFNIDLIWAGRWWPPASSRWLRDGRGIHEIIALATETACGATFGTRRR